MKTHTPCLQRPPPPQGRTNIRHTFYALNPLLEWYNKASFAPRHQQAAVKIKAERRKPSGEANRETWHALVFTVRCDRSAPALTHCSSDEMHIPESGCWRGTLGVDRLLHAQADRLLSRWFCMVLKWAVEEHTCSTGTYAMATRSCALPSPC